jgi:hypothetical protein
MFVIIVLIKIINGVVEILKIDGKKESLRIVLKHFISKSM